MAERIEGMSTEVLRQQLMSEMNRRQRLEAELIALKARIAAGDPPELLVDVAEVILEAQQAMAAGPPAGALGERVSTGKPGSRAPTRDMGPSRAWRRFRSTIDSAVNGWAAAKERDWAPEEKDPRETARVWCCRQNCQEYQTTKPKFARSRKHGWVELSPICNGTLVGSDEVCGQRMVDR